MNLLIFEYATAMGVNEPSITAEGQAMLQAIVDDFEGENTSFLISNESESLDGGQCRPIIIDGDLNQWIQDNIYHYDFCLPIAPEENFILYGLTQLIEEKGVKVVGSSSDSIRTCTDKYLTYQSLKNKVPLIPTRKVLWDDVNEYSNDISTKMVVKPADGVSCSAVQIINSKESFKKAAMRVKDVSNLSYFLLQDWVNGDSASVSLITNGKKAIPLSLNQQKINQTNGNIDYKGGTVPFHHPKEEEAKEIAKKAVESIKGLKGYVGVDLILGEEVYLVEINSRLTTPYVALRNITPFNLGKAIIESVQGKLPSEEEIKLEGEIEFRKEGNHMQLKVIN